MEAVSLVLLFLVYPAVHIWLLVHIARLKGYKLWPWFIFSFVLGPGLLIWLMMAHSHPGSKQTVM